MNHSHSRKHGAKGTSTPPKKLPSVETEGPRQTRDCCTTALKRLQTYFERGEKDEAHMDCWTRIHLEHCSSCSDFFNKLIDPDYGKQH